MQTTLLGLALALIAAIFAAFAAPFFIDWNEWRPQLEAQASALAGSRVTIAGKIDLTLLPTPAFVLRNVSLGDAVSGTGMSAAEMRGSLSLTALLSGKIEANEFVVSKPALRLAIDKDGKLVLPAGAGAGQDILVSGFVFEAGSLTIEDRRTNATFFAGDFSARGELVSREGPFRLDGGFRLNGARWIVRVSSGRFGPDHSGKVRLSLERPSDAISFDAEGVLSIVNAAPRFDGKIIAAKRSGALPWRVSSDASGDHSEIKLGNLELALGQGELPITLSGEGKIAPHANGALELTLGSKRIDLDLGDQKAATTGAAHVLPLLAEARQLFAAMPFPSRVAISADGVLAGGQMMRDVRASLRAQDGTVMLEGLEARLPGRALLILSGKQIGDEFTGPLSFEVEEPQIFARWMLGEEAAGKIALPPALALKATFASTSEEVSLNAIQAGFENTRLSGRLAVLGRPGSKAQLLADIELERPDFDVLLPIAKSFASNDMDFTFNAVASNARIQGVATRRTNISAARTANQIEIKDFTIDGFDGLNLSIKTVGSHYEYSAEITHGNGVERALAYLSDNADFAAIVTRYGAPHYPLHVAGKLVPIKSGWRLAGKSGEATFALDWNEVRGDSRLVEAILRLPETEIFAKGDLRFGANGLVEPALALTLKSSDLRKAFAITGRTAAEPIVTNGSANLARDGNNFVFDKLVFDLAGSRATGRIAIPAGATAPFSGALSFDRANAGAVLSLITGRANASYLELSVPLFANFPGTMKIDVGSLAVNERVSMQKASFQLRVGRYEAVFEDFQAQLAGGRISGSLRVADVYPRVMEIRLNAADVALADLLGTKAVRGALQVSLSLGASGSTEDDLIASISGKGTIGLSALEIERTDATAVASVFEMMAKEIPDEKKIEQALIAALERAPLKISKLEAPLVTANGVIRSASAKAKAGNIEIALSGSLNLPKRRAEALLNIDVVAAGKPAAAIRWEGPLDAPERKVDARGLIAAVSMRAIERGIQNPSNVNAPQEERAPPAKKKRSPANDVETAPLLPPPSNVPNAPQPRSQN